MKLHARVARMYLGADDELPLAASDSVETRSAVSA